MKHCIEQGYCSCVTGNCIVIQFKKLEAQLDKVRGLAERSKCTAIPTGKDNIMRMVYVVKSDDLLQAMESE